MLKNAKNATPGCVVRVSSVRQDKKASITKAKAILFSLACFHIKKKYNKKLSEAKIPAAIQYDKN